MHVRYVLAIALLAAAVGYTCAYVQYKTAIRWEITTMRLSPDERHRVVMEDIRIFFQLDRNFRLTVKSMTDDGEETIVFHSPDEGFPIGTERLVWSTDSSRVLLLGREFIVHEGSALPSGEQLYYMLRVDTGQAWCNATQQRDLPRFGVEDVRMVEWEFPLSLTEQGDVPKPSSDVL